MLRLALPALAVFAIAGAAAAQPAPSAPSPMAAMFAGWDSDHDGAVSLAEFQAARHPGATGPDPRHTPEHFRELDTDGDGRITPAEFEAHHRRPHDGN